MNILTTSKYKDRISLDTVTKKVTMSIPYNAKNN